MSELARLREMYTAALHYDDEGRLEELDEVAWAQAEELRAALELPWSAALLDMRREGRPVWPAHPHVLLEAIRVTAEEVLRRFACDCAARVLPLFEAAHADARVAAALRTAREAAGGQGEEIALEDAHIAAGAAADDAAACAAYTPGEPRALRAAVGAAWSAQACCHREARAAASRAAGEARRAKHVRDQSGPEERIWQQQHLIGLALEALSAQG